METSDLVRGFLCLWKMEIDNELAFTMLDQILENEDDLLFLGHLGVCCYSQ